MKKIALLSLVFVMLLSLFACGENNNGADTTPSTGAESTESKAEATESKAESTESEAEPEESTTQENKLQQFEQGLTDKGIKFNKSESTDNATWFGAEKCYCYEFGEGAEYGYAYVYLFDKESESYKQAVKENKISYLPEYGSSSKEVIFCDDICIQFCFYNGHLDIKAEIETIFNNIK